jgi:hypothetical protein
VKNFLLRNPRVLPSILLLTGVAAAVLPACTRKEATAPAPAAKPAVAASASHAPTLPPASAEPPATMAGAPPTPDSVAVTGTVQETLNASDYTYLRLKTAGGDVWAAVLKAKVKKGENVTVVNAVPMDGFESKTLKRKFDRIVFGQLAGPGSAAPAANPRASSPAVAPMASGHESADLTQAREEMKVQHAAAASGPEIVDVIKVPKAEGADGKTVAELFAQRAALKDKPVAVRGRVVKVVKGVMGKNWLHLRDGTGSREARDDDVTVTTKDEAAAGGVVLVRGTLRLDKDYGAGYVYPVIIEEVRVSK